MALQTCFSRMRCRSPWVVRTAAHVTVSWRYSLAVRLLFCCSALDTAGLIRCSLRARFSQIHIAIVLTVSELELHQNCQVHKRIPALYLKRYIVIGCTELHLEKSHAALFTRSSTGMWDIIYTSIRLTKSSLFSLIIFNFSVIMSI